jgi:hypothetical protein
VIALFLGGALAMFLALLGGDYVGRGRKSLIYMLTFGAQSVVVGIGILIVAGFAPIVLFYALILFLRLIF